MVCSVAGPDREGSLRGGHPAVERKPRLQHTQLVDRQIEQALPGQTHILIRLPIHASLKEAGRLHCSTQVSPQHGPQVVQEEDLEQLDKPG